MTKQARKALRSVGIPSVQWSDQYRQYFARIGYNRSKDGKRTRAFKYLGKDEAGAVRAATVLKAEWRRLKREQGKGAVWNPIHSDAVSPSLARLSQAEQEAVIRRYHAEQTDNALELGIGEQGDGVVEQTPRQRIEQVQEQYLAYRKGKLGIGHGQGINAKSYLSEQRDLKNGLLSVDPKSMIDTLGYAEIETLHDAINRRVDGTDNGISKRTANNYWAAVCRMLKWAHKQANVAYRHAEHAEDLFKDKFKNANDPKIVQYADVKDAIKKMMNAANDRQRLYVYLALNAGHYQVDIGSLLKAEIVKYQGHDAIQRRRSKTSHQNDIEALHTLWPETAALLKSELAKENEWGLALLSKAGTPLYRRNPHCDIISDTYLQLQQDCDVQLPFKQYRKLGATAMQRLGGDEVRRLYKAGTIDSGDKVYVVEAFDKLTPHLQAWGDELRKDGILF